jgi:hypothetical protein
MPIPICALDAAASTVQVKQHAQNANALIVFMTLPVSPKRSEPNRMAVL